MLNITVWIEESDLQNFTALYNAYNKNEKIDKTIPKFYIIKPNTSTIELNIPFDFYLILSNLNNVKNINDSHESVINELTIIKNILDETFNHGLQPEVIYSAMKILKENPNLTIEEALKNGYNEWVK